MHRLTWSYQLFFLLLLCSHEIPSSFCNLSSIQHLDLSNNRLSGNIPENLFTSDTLSHLFLQNNNFHGRIPQFCFATDSPLTDLILNGNQLEGPLPPSLVNCHSLEVLDVGNNRINDTFPHRLANLPYLQVLVLRSNKFHGPIASSNTRIPFPKLRILDLSHNEFTGVLPTRYFQNFSAMMQGDNNSAEAEYKTSDYEYYSLVLTWKGNDIKMERIFKIFATVDMSSNRFHGEIPDVVGKLNSLNGLNFSHNNLIGSIPPSLGDMKALESLDLSANKLVGEIPRELTKLNFLGVINLSENQLEGRIPRDNHFETLPNNSYSGNSRLCGFPLSEECSSAEAPEPAPTRFHEDIDTSRWFDWKFAMMGYGSGVVIGLSMGYMVFATGRPLWFVRMVERKQFKNLRRHNKRSRGRRRRN